MKNSIKRVFALFMGVAVTLFGVLSAQAEAMFYIGSNEYADWPTANSAANNGDTVVVGTDAAFSDRLSKELTIDLNGRSLVYNAGYMYADAVFTVIDSGEGAGRFVFDTGWVTACGTLDLSALNSDQLTRNSGKIQTQSTTVVKFPRGMALETCDSFFATKRTGAQIVVQGVTYTYDGSDWASAGAPSTYDISVTPPVNGTLAVSATSGIEAGTTITVTATPATDYQLVSVTTNGVALSGTSFTMPAEAVTVAATFEEIVVVYSLTIGEPSVASLGESFARLALTVEKLGTGATKAAVTLRWGTDANDLAHALVLGDAAEGETKVGSLTGLAADTVYNYAFTVTNDADPSETKTATGVFMTKGASSGERVHEDAYPETLEDGKVVTYDADNAGDPNTLEPGSPYCVVDASGYTYAYTSTVTNPGQVYHFRDADDFQYNASARIGDTYYLFLTDAVDAAKTGDTIDLLRNNYAVAKTMSVFNKRLTVQGNGFTVKVARPFLDNTGYVNPTCTDTPKTVFVAGNGSDLRLKDMTVMGGGQQLGPTAPGDDSSNTPAIVLSYVAVLDMDHVTVKRSQGGLYVGGSARAHLNACNLVKNARYCGGGFYNLGILVVENSSLSENRSLSVSGSGAAGENRGLMVANNCVILNNASTWFGGAINNLNNYTGNTGIAYLMNMTMAGNFSSHSRDNGGGGIGIQISSGDIYMLNCILCNNYRYHSAEGNGSVEVSDIRSEVGNNNFLYSACGVWTGDATPIFSHCETIDAAREDVFKGYSPFARTYEQANVTKIEIPAPAMENDPAVPDARYAPITEDSAAYVGNDGVYTYFNASNWRSAANNGDISWLRMSYKTKDGAMQPLGNCQAADESDLVTTYYESAFAENVTDRELGVIGASGFGTFKTVYTLYLLKKPVNGTVSDNLLLTGKSYFEGDEVTVVATPAAKCSFIGWYDEDDGLVSDKAAYTFVMEGDKKLYPKFSAPSETVTLNVQCEQSVKGTHTDFPITVTRAWLKKVGLIDSEDADIDDDKKAEIKAALNQPDAENGLNHVWMDYVLGGLEPGDPDGRIWIRADQTTDKTTLRFRMQELSQTKDCGFTVKYRLLSKSAESAADYDRAVALANSGSFEVSVTSDQLTHRVIDMIFVPTGYSTSCEYVTTVNTAGIMKVETDKKVEILAAPFVGFSPTDNLPIEATGYLKASCLSEGDVLYVYDMENSNYLAWAVQANGTWATVDTYQIVNGMVSYVGGADASRTNALPRGAGAWLERKDVTKPIYLYGQVDPSATVTPLVSGFNLVGSPVAGATFDVSKMTPPAKTGESGDRIVIPSGSAPINCYYNTDLNAWAWKKGVVTTLTNKKGEPILNPVTKQPMTGISYEWTTEGMEIPAGLGFWYFNSSASPINLEWLLIQE